MLYVDTNRMLYVYKYPLRHTVMAIIIRPIKIVTTLPKNREIQLDERYVASIPHWRNRGTRLTHRKLKHWILRASRLGPVIMNNVISECIYPTCQKINTLNHEIIEAFYKKHHIAIGKASWFDSDVPSDFDIFF